MSENKLVIRFVSNGIFAVSSQQSTADKGEVVPVFLPLVNGQLPQEAAESLKIIFGKRRPKVILVLPRRQVIFKYFALPSKNPNELRRMVELQVERGLPFPLEEMLFQVVPAGTDNHGLTRVVVAIVRQRSVKECIDVLARAGVHPSLCAASAFGVASWFVARQASQAKGAACVIDLETDGMEICFCLGDQLIFARSIAMADEAKDHNDLGFQMDRSLQAFREVYPDVSIDKVVMTGIRGGIWEKVGEVVRQKLGVPIEQIPLGTEDEEDPVTRISQCCVSGFMLRLDIGADLLPAAAQSHHDARKELISLIRMVLALVFVLSSLVFMAYNRIGRQEHTLKILEMALSRTKNDYERAKQNVRLSELIENQLKDRVIIVDIFKELYSLLPSSVVVTNVQFADGSLSFLGQTKESADVGMVQKAMMNSKNFKDVTLQYANRPQRLAMEYTEFKITARVTGAREVSP